MPKPDQFIMILKKQNKNLQTKYAVTKSFFCNSKDAFIIVSVL